MAVPPTQSLPVGVLGTVVAFISAQQVSVVVGIVAGVLTGVAMLLRIYREIRALREERGMCRACRSNRLSK